ncbi:MAG: 6-carboxytetrahydropterin synthase [Candidatus Thermoplasmatota archaeon]
MESYIYIDGWKAKIRFSSAHIIPEYKKCGRLHGHSYAVHAKITGIPDEKGIIIDFSSLKEILKDIVNSLDHRILIPSENNGMKLDKINNNIEIKVIGKNYVFPKEDCVLLPVESTSAENLSKYILDELIERLSLPDRIKKVEIGVDEGYGQGARITKEL